MMFVRRRCYSSSRAATSTSSPDKFRSLPPLFCSSYLYFPLSFVLNSTRCASTIPVSARSKEETGSGDGGSDVEDEEKDIKL